MSRLNSGTLEQQRGEPEAGGGDHGVFGGGAVDHAPAQPQPGDQHHRDAGPEQDRGQHQAVPEPQPGQVQRLQERVVQSGAAGAEPADGQQGCAQATEPGGSGFGGDRECGQT